MLTRSTASGATCRAAARLPAVAGQRHTHVPVANERVVLDGENMPYTPGAVGSTIPRPERGVLHIEGDWWRIIGLEIIHGNNADVGARF